MSGIFLRVSLRTTCYQLRNGHAFRCSTERLRIHNWRMPSTVVFEPNDTQALSRYLRSMFELCKIAKNIAVCFGPLLCQSITSVYAATFAICCKASFANAIARRGVRSRQSSSSNDILWHKMHLSAIASNAGASRFPDRMRIGVRRTSQHARALSLHNPYVVDRVVFRDQLQGESSRHD